MENRRKGALYPAIMIEYGFLSRNVSTPKRYLEIRDTRLELKAKKDPMQLPYKIVLNSTFGASKDQYNPLFDPRMANNICVAGQLLLLDLIEKIEKYGKLIQTNTDGIYIKLEKESDIAVVKQVAKEWEKRTRLDLEWEVFSKIYQKDVNNYIIIDSNGGYKSKGSYLKKLSAIDYDLPVVNEALVNYFVNSNSIENTINNCEDLIKFQKIVKISKLYKYARYGDDEIGDKVLRVFASKDENAKGVFKVKHITDENGEIQEKIEKIANTPEKCFIYNDEVIGKEIPNELDKQYYIDIAHKRLNDFLDSTKVKKPKQQSDIKYVSNDVKEVVLKVLDDFKGDFIDFLLTLSEEKSINSKHLKILTMLNYFEKFGKNKKLLKIIEMFEQLAMRKQIKFRDIENMGIVEDVLIKYTKKSTETQYREIDMIGYLREISNTIENKPLSIKQQVKLEIEYLGETNYINKQASDKFYIVVDFQTFSSKTRPVLVLRQINNGIQITAKIKDSNSYIENPFKLFDVLRVNKFKEEQKSVMLDGKWTKSDELQKIIVDWEVF
jgi:hypothetical protein